MTELGVHIEAVYQDSDLIEVVVTAANRGFSGRSSFYTEETQLREVARILSGFPASAGDRREIFLGERVWDDDAHGLGLRLSCRDGLGHVSVEAKLMTSADRSGIRQSVVLIVATEAAAVDAFVKELVALAEVRRGTAFLRSAG